MVCVTRVKRDGRRQANPPPSHLRVSSRDDKNGSNFLFVLLFDREKWLAHAFSLVNREWPT
jgi:hypothetical protein